jgi:hypothetical protein
MAMKRNVFWPDVSTLPDVAWAVKQGVWAAGFVAVVTGIVALVALSLHTAVLGLGASALVDSAIFAAVAYGIHKNSRFAAVSGLVIYLVERIYMFKAAGVHGGGATAMVVILTLAFVTAIRGTFAYHKLTAPMARAGNVTSATAQ